MGCDKSKFHQKNIENTKWSNDTLTVPKSQCTEIILLHKYKVISQYKRWAEYKVMG